MKKIVFNAGWDYHTMRLPDDVERAVRADQGLLYGGDPDLTRFFSRGGKLLMYHGWADPLVTPDASLIMFKRINEAMGPAATSSLALFMVPVMGHCQGGARHRRLRQDRGTRSMGGVRHQTSVDSGLPHDRHRDRSNAATVCVPGDRALYRQRQHR